MSPYLITLVILFSFSVAACLILWMALESSRKYILFLLNQYQPFKKKDRLMSPNELKLFSILKSLPILNDFDIFPQVPYSSLLEVDPDTADLGMRFEVINGYRSDFVITYKSNSSVVLVIELNDQSHFYNYKKARDLFVYTALKKVGIPCLVLKTKDMIKPNQIELDVKALLKINS